MISLPSLKVIREALIASPVKSAEHAVECARALMELDITLAAAQVDAVKAAVPPPTPGPKTGKPPKKTPFVEKKDEPEGRA